MRNNPKKIWLKILPIIGVFFTYSLFAQSDKIAKKYAKSISTTDLKAYLSVLASDSLEGRETGRPGGKKAEMFIEKHFKSIGLSPGDTQNVSFTQPYPLQTAKWQNVYLKKGNEVRENFQGFLNFSYYETRGEEIIELRFLTDSSQLETYDWENTMAAIQANEYWGNTDLFAKRIESLGGLGLWILRASDASFETNLQRFKTNSIRGIERLELPNPKSALIFANQEVTEWVFSKSLEQIKNGEKTKLVYNADLLKDKLYASNVVGFIPGKEKPSEWVIITSHFDHIGIGTDGKINNGADDDGSGTVAVMEIAQAFAEAYKQGNAPVRSILFMCVSGEEKGLFGSEYYTRNPLFPLESTVVNLNIDMIGRTDPAHEGKDPYVYLIGSDKLSSQLHSISENVNQATVKLDLDYTYNDEKDPNRFYYRSDHYNFARNNIPVIFYFNGTHADYHKPTDTIEKINFDLLKKRTELVFFTAWELANVKDRIIVDSNKK